MTEGKGTQWESSRGKQVGQLERERSSRMQGTVRHRHCRGGKWESTTGGSKCVFVGKQVAAGKVQGTMIRLPMPHCLPPTTSCFPDATFLAAGWTNLR